MRLTLCDPMDCSPPSSSVHGILQARILEQAAIPFSRESFQLRDQIWVSRIAGSFFTIWATREAWLQHDTLCHITLLSSCLKRWDCSPALYLNSHVTRFAGAMWPQAWIVLVLSKHFPVWKMLRHWFWKEDVLQVRQSQPLWTIQTSPSAAAGGWMKIISTTASHKLHFAAVYNKS